MRAWLMFAALGSMACSTTVREREVVYVPVGLHVHRACPCPAPVRAHRAMSTETHVGRDAVPRMRGSQHSTHPVQGRNDGVKWGRARGKRKPPGLEIARAERAESPPGLAKRRQK